MSSTGGFFQPAAGLPAGHTAFSWAAPVVASPGIIALAALGNGAASRTAAAAGSSVPGGHTAFSWAFGSAAGAAAPQELEHAIEHLETVAAQVQTNAAEKTENHSRVEAALVLQGAAGAALFQVPHEYYDLSLTQRALCKTILLENTAAASSTATGSPFTSRFVAVVLQYCTKLDLPRLSKQLKGAADMAAAGSKAPAALAIPGAIKQAVKPHALPPGAHVTAKEVSAAKFNFAVAQPADSDRLSGYKHNAVTPFGMTSPVPVLITRQVAELPKVQPAAPYVWLGGGEVNLKLRLPVVQLAAALAATEVHAAVARGSEEEEEE